MIYIDASDDTIDQEVKRVCAPLFATSQFMQGGHSEVTINATVTFVKFESRVYAVTCHHVLSAFLTQAYKTGRRIVPSIHSGRSIHQFYGYGPQGQYRWTFLSCRDFPSIANINNQRELDELKRRNLERPDIAIADITSIWPTFSALRNAEPINLDSWVEPDWSVAQPVWMAYGFPDGHKYRTDDKIATPMPRVAVELASSVPSADKPTYMLCSTLTREHGWGFSGISGGPVLVAHTEENRYAYVGITFEGTPSATQLEKTSESFIDERDIILKGYQLTPVIFQDWLTLPKFSVELS